MGIDLLLGFGMKFLPYILAVVAVVGAYFGVKAKGASDERKKRDLADAKAREQFQGRVDDARAKDQEIDKRVHEETQPVPPPPDPPVKPGDTFKFLWPIVLTLLIGGCTIFQPQPAVRIDIPPRPELVACPSKPQTEGVIRETEEGPALVLLLPKAIALRSWMAIAQRCWSNHETILLGHIEKLENRLKAVQP